MARYKGKMKSKKFFSCILKKKWLFSKKEGEDSEPVVAGLGWGGWARKKEVRKDLCTVADNAMGSKKSQVKFMAARE